MVWDGPCNNFALTRACNTRCPNEPRKEEAWPARPLRRPTREAVRPFREAASPHEPSAQSSREAPSAYKEGPVERASLIADRRSVCRKLKAEVGSGRTTRIRSVAPA